MMYINVLPRNLPGRTGENHENLLGESVNWLRRDHEPPEYGARMLTTRRRHSPVNTWYGMDWLKRDEERK
jgi:hypothetical protein